MSMQQVYKTRSYTWITVRFMSQMDEWSLTEVSYLTKPALCLQLQSEQRCKPDCPGSDVPVRNFQKALKSSRVPKSSRASQEILGLIQGYSQRSQDLRCHCQPSSLLSPCSRKRHHRKSFQYLHKWKCVSVLNDRLWKWISHHHLGFLWKGSDLTR